MKRNTLTTSILLGSILLLIALVGCSKNNPVSSSTLQPSAPFANRLISRAIASEIEIAGRVASIDPATRTMTLTGSSVVIVIDAQATVVLKSSGSETPLSLDSINLNDSAEVRGNMQSGGSLLANRVRIRKDDNGGGSEASEIELHGRILTVNAELRTMTVSSYPFAITISNNAAITKKTSSGVTPITVNDLAPFDSVEIRGTIQLDSSILADRIRVRTRNEGDFHSDLEFKDIITAIDTVAGTFTVAGRTETITTDSLTVIFSKQSSNPRGTGRSSLSDGSDDNGKTDDSLMTRVTLAQLAVGDTVEVRANIISATTLYAVAVRMEDGSNDDQGDDHSAKNNTVATVKE